MIVKNHVRFAIVLATVLVTVLLGGCVSAPLQPQGTPQERQTRLEQLQQFQFSGGLGIWTDDQSLSGRLRWQQLNDQLAVELRGPLGLGRLQLDYADAMASLTRGNTVLAQGPSLDNVVQRGLGLAAPVPMAQLQQWVKGLPGEAATVATDEQGKLSTVAYTDGTGVRWQARFLRYVDVDGLVLPALITATGGPYNVRVVLNDWQVATSSVDPPPTPSNTRLVIPVR